MAPDLIAVDEIGGQQDVDAIFGVINCGCRLLATAHGYSMDDVRDRAGIRRLVENRFLRGMLCLEAIRQDRSLIYLTARATGCAGTIRWEAGHG